MPIQDETLCKDEEHNDLFVPLQPGAATLAWLAWLAWLPILDPSLLLLPAYTVIKTLWAVMVSEELSRRHVTSDGLIFLRGFAFFEKF